MKSWLRWALGLSIAAMMVGLPYVHFRATYNHERRLREVTAGRFYRCGQLTADGFREAFARYGIRTVINLEDENPDPMLPVSYYQAKPATPESEVCRHAGVRYVLINFDMPRRDVAAFERPKAVDQFLELLDDPSSYPILLHCKAGLHRTGRLTAVYRMEYERWPVADAMRELRANGYGETMANSADDYIYSYVETYRPRWLNERKTAAAKPAAKEAVPEGPGGPVDDDP
jgi:tyrosine-protein phosphatase SIW14